MQTVSTIRESDLLSWSSRLLSITGLWPEARSDLRFLLYLAYLLPFGAFEYVSLVRYFGDADRTLRSLTEVIPTTMMILKSLMFRKNAGLLAPLLKALKRDVSRGCYETAEEGKVVLRYSKIAKMYIRSSTILIFSVVTMLYAVPIVRQALMLSATETNSTIIYEMPYQISFPYQVTKFRTYVLACLYQLPVPTIYTVGSLGPDVLLVALTMHICAQLGVLRLRITNVPTDDSSYHDEMRALIDRHATLVHMATVLENTFSNLLLVQSLGLTFVICVVGFELLRMAEEGMGGGTINFLFFSMAIVMLAFSYCFMGECLINESVAISDACYDSRWYDVRGVLARPIALCITRSQKPLCLTAGKFYVFSFDSFASIMKASMAYLSLLRKIVH